MIETTVQSRARILTLAFGATAAMWICAYCSFLFAGKIGGEILFVLSAACLFQAGRHATSRAEGCSIGITSATINLLLIGSIVGGQHASDMLMTGAFWVIGLYISSGLLGVLGATFNASIQQSHKEVDWTFAFTTVASAIVFLMLVTGGLVTGLEAGLAVPDWPNSYGHNMLLYPLSEMISSENSGVFFEHAHRLTGMFVGLTSLVLLVCVLRWGQGMKARVMVIVIFLLVCVQGLLGGLRVTGILTMSQDPSILSPNIWLGVVHGVLAQCIFTLFVWLSSLMSNAWQVPTQLTSKKEMSNAWQVPTPLTSKKDRLFAHLLCAAMLLQLILGALYRHMLGDEILAAKTSHVLYTHIALAFGVLVLAIVVGIRFIGLGHPVFKRLGTILLSLVSLQLLLGGGALIAIMIHKGETIPVYEVLMTTAHQANGALLLATSVMCFVWSIRFKSKGTAS